MLPTGKSRTALLIIMGILTLNLCVCGMFAYSGSDVPVVGPRYVGASGSGVSSGNSSSSSGGIFVVPGGSSIRSGSTGSRSTFGGGSSSGK